MDTDKHHVITPIKEENPADKKCWINTPDIKKCKIDNKRCFRDKKSDRKESMIPRLKNNWIFSKARDRSSLPSDKQSYSVSHFSTGDAQKKKTSRAEVRDQKIADYYNKIEEFMKTSMDSKETSPKPKTSGKKTGSLPSARKMISDTLVLTKGKHKTGNVSSLTNNIRQISDIWLKTSNELSHTLKTLKNNPGIDPLEIEVESVRIQLAIKQAKSLTLLKTRNVIAEAKKLMERREIIRSELEKILSDANERWKNEDVIDSLLMDVSKSSTAKERLNEKGDSTKKLKRALEKSPVNSEVLDAVEKIISDEPNIVLSKEITKHHSDDSVTVLKLKKKLNDEFAKHGNLRKINPAIKPIPASRESQLLKDEIQRKNLTITNLNNKIFELQKLCNEHCAKNGQLQIQLTEFHEKIQWNQILWKQIGKLKEKIKNLQKSNKALEEQKIELENKIRKLDLELDKLLKLNRLLNDKQYLLSSTEKFVELSSDSGSGEDVSGKEKGKDFQSAVEKILLEKENVVEQLKTMLVLMKEQENEAQKQVAVFQSKIKELESRSKRNF